jgi:hypothetical protein
MPTQSKHPAPRRFQRACVDLEGKTGEGSPGSWAITVSFFSRRRGRRKARKAARAQTERRPSLPVRAELHLGSIIALFFSAERAFSGGSARSRDDLSQDLGW